MPEASAWPEHHPPLVENLGCHANERERKEATRAEWSRGCGILVPEGSIKMLLQLVDSFSP